MIFITLLVVLLFFINMLSIVLYGIDKFKVANGGWRIPEITLLLAAFFGPFGAYAGMLLFRHKTRKIKFILVPIFMFIQLGFLLYLRFVVSATVKML